MLISLVQEMMVEAWVVEGLDAGFITGSQVWREHWEYLPNSLQFFLNFHRNEFFISLERRSSECGSRCFLKNAWKCVRV